MKKEITLNVPISIDWEDVTLSEVYSDLIRLKEKGCTHIEIGVNSDYGETTVYFNPKCRRIETEEEYQIRLVDEKWQQKNKDLADQMEYERLKQKFEQ